MSNQPRFLHTDDYRPYCTEETFQLLLDEDDSIRIALEDACIENVSGKLGNRYDMELMLQQRGAKRSPLLISILARLVVFDLHQRQDVEMSDTQWEKYYEVVGSPNQMTGKPGILNELEDGRRNPNNWPKLPDEGGEGDAPSHQISFDSLPKRDNRISRGCRRTDPFNQR